MDVAPGTPGDEQTEAPAGRRGLNLGLGVLALLLACAAAFGGVLVHQERQDRQRAAAEREQDGEVLAAARQEIEAFVNLDYTKAQESIDAVAAGATGEFAQQYDTSTKDVVKDLTRARSVMEGEVLWAGLVDSGKDSASVIVATSGTVANTSTADKPVAREFRIKVDLVREDDVWKTSNVEFVK